MTMCSIHKLSVFKNYHETAVIGNMLLTDFIIEIKEGLFRTDIEKIRAAKSKEERDRIKATLPAVTISGTFEPTRANSNLVKHSGFICIDIDTKPEGIDWETLRDTAGGWDNVYFSSLSASGQGVFLVIPITQPEQHYLHFKALEAEFLPIGITIDKACKDIARLRGISYDPDAIYNPGAKKYDLIYKEPKPRQTQPYAYRGTSHSPIETVRRMIREAVEGERHETILRASILLGGYILTGKLSESEAEAVLRSEAENKLPTQRHNGAYKTIRDGIKHGKQKPIER